MLFKELVNSRYSVRKYSDKEVKREDVYKCIESAGVSPSACNSQPWYYVIIDNSEVRDQVAATTYNSIIKFNKFVSEAPIIVALVNTKGTLPSKIAEHTKGRHYDIFDCGISAGFFTLQAAELGLGTCMIGWFDEKKLKEVISVPDKYSIELLITVGYPDEGEKNSKKRKELDKISALNNFRGD